LRAAIANEITTLNGITNETDTPRDIRQRRAQVRTLLQVRRLLDHSGRATLGSDVQLLTTVANALGRSFPNNDEFTLLLGDAAANYRDVIAQVATTLREELSGLPSSPFTDAAEQALDFIDVNLAKAGGATTPAAAARTLSRTATLLSRAQTFIRQARTTAPQREEFTARIGGLFFRANDGLTPVADFSSAAGVLVIAGTQRLGPQGETQTLTLSLDNVRGGTTVRLLGDLVSGNSATYTTTTPTNSMTFTSVSGTARVTLDLLANTVSGDFSFVANQDALDPLDSAGDASVIVTSGEFFVRLE